MAPYFLFPAAVTTKVAVQSHPASCLSALALPISGAGQTLPHRLWTKSVAASTGIDMPASGENPGTSNFTKDVKHSGHTDLDILTKPFLGCPFTPFVWQSFFVKWVGQVKSTQPTLLWLVMGSSLPGFQLRQRGDDITLTFPCKNIASQNPNQVCLTQTQTLLHHCFYAVQWFLFHCQCSLIWCSSLCFNGIELEDMTECVTTSSVTSIIPLSTPSLCSGSHSRPCGHNYGLPLKLFCQKMLDI